MESLGYHTEGGEGALGMPEGGAVKEGGLEVKEMQKIPLILSASLVRPSFTEYLDRGFKIRGDNPFFSVSRQFLGCCNVILRFLVFVKGGRKLKIQ